MNDNNNKPLENQLTVFSLSWQDFVTARKWVFFYH